MRVCTQGIAKFMTYVIYKDDLAECARFLATIYGCNQIKSSNNAALHTNITQLIVLFKISLIINGMVVVCFIVAPIGIYLWSQELILILPIFTPIADESTTFGYVVLLVYHCMLVYIAMGLLAIVDATFLIFSFNALPLSNLFDNGFTRLNEYLLKCSSNDLAADTLRAKIEIRNLAMMWKEYRKYVKVV